MSVDTKELYLKETIKLANTLSIKLSDVADAMNNYVTLQYGADKVNPDYPASWRYYLSVAGEYHFVDTQMTIVSLDTLETIVFNKTNLNIHTATRNAYEFGSRYYMDLVDRYPDQELLIQGILYPCDINTAINAPDGTILAYPKGLIEPQEITLVHEIEQRIQLYQVRNHNRSYYHSDEYYFIGYYALFYLNLVPMILNLRLKRCKSPEAHSFHIHMYLSSHSDLGQYIAYLTLKQKLFLYRNILYIENNSGKQDTFKTLVEYILTHRDIPISDYSIRHVSSFDADLHPEYIARKKAINHVSFSIDKETTTLIDLLDKEKMSAYGNTDYIAEHTERVEKQIVYSRSSVIQTKDIESSMVDESDTSPYSLTSILIAYWALFSSRGLYSTIVYFKDPTTGKQRSLYAEDAFIYYLYLNYQRHGVDITTIPDFLVENILRNPRPSINEFRSITETHPELSDWLPEYLMSKFVNYSSLFSVNSFYKMVSEIYANMNHLHKLAYNFQDPMNIAVITKAHENMYERRELRFSSYNSSYSDWLAARNLPSYSYTRDEADTLIRDLFTNATGYQTDPLKDVKNIQTAMLNVMRQLSSYSIQFLQEINTKPVVLVNEGVVGIENKESILKYLYPVIESWDTLEQSALIKDYIEMIEETSLSGDYQRPVYTGHHSWLDSEILTVIDGNVSNVSLYEQDTVLEIDYSGQDPAIYAQYRILGIESFLSLPESERLALLELTHL